MAWDNPPKEIWEWLKDIRDELRGIIGSVTKQEFTWTTIVGKNRVETIKYYKNSELLLTLLFTWNSTTALLEKIERT